jgi:hypothetical protein
VEAIERGNAVAAREAAIRHVDNARDAAFEMLAATADREEIG